MEILMARMTLSDKASRVLKMLIGMRTPRVASAMQAYGLTDADLQEGWTLLQNVSRTKLDNTKSGSLSIGTLDHLDAWENRWFPVAAATVERRFPAVHAQLFKNLSQTQGPGVAITVRTFVERYDEMVAGAGTYGAEGTAAKAVLEARGLTSAVVDAARALLETVGKVETAPCGATLEDEQKRSEKAEADLWAWYLEWSAIARVAISQRALLKQMGFVSTRAKGSAAEPAEDDDEQDVVAPITGVIQKMSPTTPITTKPVNGAPHD
jgi:hypothetical protein